MNADSVLRYLLSLWNYISDMVIGWLIVIGVILLLLLIFHCYRSTLVMAMRLIRKTKPRVRYLAQRKNEPARKELRALRTDVQKILRMIRAYSYDHIPDAAVTAAGSSMEAADRAIQALELDRVADNAAAVRRILKNVLSQLDNAEEALRRR